MRVTLFVFGTMLAATVGVLLLWRPAMTLALALLGAAISLWRMKRPVKAAARAEAAPPRPVAPPPAMAAPDAAPAPEGDAEAAVRARRAAAGWTVEPAVAGPPWLVAVQDGVRVALRTSPRGPRVTGDDIADAVAAKVRENAGYAAVISVNRPADLIAAEAKEAAANVGEAFRKVGEALGQALKNASTNQE
jgi:hypothetical protein